jgi:hypothetical protein
MESLKKVIGYVIGFLLVSGVIYLIRGGDKLKEFEEYYSADGRFSVLFPGEPKESLQSVRTAAGQINLVMLTAGSKTSGFAVGYTDYPRNVVESSDPEEMLDGARDGAVRNVGGRLIDETPLDFHGHPAREIRVEAPKKTSIRSRLILIENRLYQLVVISKSARILDEKGSEFFDSFTVDGVE